MNVESLYDCLGKRYEVTSDCRIFRKGTRLLVKNIDIRKSNGVVLVRFVCNVRLEAFHQQESYIDAFEFADCIGGMIKECKDEAD